MSVVMRNEAGWLFRIHQFMILFAHSVLASAYIYEVDRTALTGHGKPNETRIIKQSKQLNSIQHKITFFPEKFWVRLVG